MNTVAKILFFVAFGAVISAGVYFYSIDELNKAIFFGILLGFVIWMFIMTLISGRRKVKMDLSPSIVFGSEELNEALHHLNIKEEYYEYLLKPKDEHETMLLSKTIQAFPNLVIETKDEAMKNLKIVKSLKEKVLNDISLTEEEVLEVRETKEKNDYIKVHRLMKSVLG